MIVGCLKANGQTQTYGESREGKVVKQTEQVRRSERSGEWRSAQ